MTANSLRGRTRWRHSMKQKKKQAFVDGRLQECGLYISCSWLDAGETAVLPSPSSVIPAAKPRRTGRVWARMGGRATAYSCPPHPSSLVAPSLWFALGSLNLAYLWAGCCSSPFARSHSRYPLRFSSPRIYRDCADSRKVEHGLTPR